MAISTSTQWQLAQDAAARYESVLVPTILGPFAEALVEWSDIQPGETVLDVGCGTGAAARYAATIVKPNGRVIGVDINPGMLEVARTVSATEGNAIEWRELSAYELTREITNVDVVLCAQVLQFLADRQQALSEMGRVLKSDGTLFLSLWCNLEDNPYFDALIKAMSTHIGESTAKGLLAAFALTDMVEVEQLLAEAGFKLLETAVAQKNLPLPPLEEFVPRHISATPMIAGYQAAPPAAQQSVVEELVEGLASYRTDKESGEFVLPFSSYLIKAAVR